MDDEIRRWLRAREIGCKTTIGLGHQNRISKQLFSSIAKVRSWNPADTVKDTHHGGIFNFDFSQDGYVTFISFHIEICNFIIINKTAFNDSYHEV